MAEIPPIVRGFLGVFPTQHLRVLGWVFSHRAATQVPAVAPYPAPAGIVRPFSAAISAGAADPSSRQEGYFFVLERLL